MSFRLVSCHVGVLIGLLNCVIITGLIGAACGQLETVLKYGHASSLLTNAMSNGKAVVKVQNGTAVKSSNGSLNGVYSNGNGNGVHHY